MAVQLREHFRSQVQLGNEGSDAGGAGRAFASPTSIGISVEHGRRRAAAAEARSLRV